MEMRLNVAWVEDEDRKVGKCKNNALNAMVNILKGFAPPRVPNNQQDQDGRN